MAHQVFISFSSKDVEVATRIRAGLEARHIPCWMSTRDVPVGADFQESIIDALEKAKVMVLVFSTNANNSKEMKKELVLAGEYELPVLPVRIEKVLPSGAFRFQFTTRQYLDLFEDWDANLSKLAGQIMQVSSAPAPAEPAPQAPDHGAKPVDEKGEPAKPTPWARLAAAAALGGAVIVLWAESHSNDGQGEAGTSASSDATAAVKASATATASAPAADRAEPPAVFSTEGVPAVGWAGFVYVAMPIGSDPADAAKRVFGLHVSKVFKGDPGEHAGLLANDVITSIDGNALETETAWSAVVRESPPGQTFILGVEREGRHVDLRLVLGDVRPAIAQGNASALSYVGTIFLQGTKTIPVDYALALAWFKQAEALGASEAMFALGTMYQTGKGAPEDRKQALDWFRKAAEHGNPYAQTLLGNAYRDGAGVGQDAARAFDFYQKAAVANNVEALRNLGDFYAGGVAVTQDYAAAMRCYLKAAAGGDGAAMNSIGILYAYGRGVEKDYAAALTWYRQGAALGNASAMSHLGSHYADGLGVTQDKARALAWFGKGAELGSTTAMVNLGAMYSNGEGVAQDYATGMRWFRKAAALHDPSAMTNLGKSYEYGLGAPQDKEQALRWYVQAAQLGDTEAARHAALLYADGKGVAAADPAAALRWMRFAAARGDSDAKQWLSSNGYN